MLLGKEHHLLLPIDAYIWLLLHILCNMHTVVEQSGFLIRSYDAPNSTGRCSVAQCYAKTWASLGQIKMSLYC